MVTGQHPPRELAAISVRLNRRCSSAIVCPQAVPLGHCTNVFEF
jgi:hypothetical protein